MTIIIGKTAGNDCEVVFLAGLWELEPTPEPTPWQKAGVYEQKAGVYEKKAAGFVGKAL